MTQPIRKHREHGSQGIFAFVRDAAARFPRTRASLTTVGVLIVGSILLAATLLAARQTPSQDEAAIRLVCQNAVQAEQTLPIPPTTYHGGTMSATIQQQMLDHVVVVMSQYYTGDVLAREVDSLQTYIRREQQGGIRYLDAGANPLTFHQIIINQNSATVTAQGVTWTKVAQDQGNGKLATATPHNTVNFIFTLVKVNGQWLISGESWSFAPGSNP